DPVMTSTPLHLRLDGVGFGFPGRRVLTDVSLTVPAGARIGLIGENGAGKTTLLHLAAGLLVPTTGTVHRPEGTGLLRQQLDLPARATVG
ncbi:ATP-binding cassette domain-containing protein, partial [Escherichia coli]|uniref:ATP-binding cassette domain-containing protein n=1 Tax=Escherichia coli TaxID=562 RepID=UPI002485942B